MGLRWLGRRSPGLGREARWFMRRQPFMVPRHSTSFRGFAERLTERSRESENPEQIKKLLVHAFLEDLRRAYRRRRWVVFPKRSGWRRTAYTTVLLDNVTEENGGWELLRLISEVRNETGELDPLLVVAASNERPAALDAGDSGRLYSPQEAGDALKTWLDNLPSKRQRLAESARYLWIGLPPARTPRDGAHGTGEGEEDFGPPPAPLLSRRGVGETLLALATVLVLLPVTQSAIGSWAAECVYFRSGFHDGVSVKTVEIEPDDRQCIGYSDNAVQVFGTNERLRKAQQAIFAQNETAEKLRRQQSGRPYLSIVHFVGLTHRDAAPDTDHAAAEELEGLLLRQRAQNVKSKTQPLLRVIVANGGDGMRKAPEVVREMLRPLFDADPSVVGVIGLDRTVEETERAITEIGLAGVPTIGTTLTGSGLGDRSPLYFQVVPDNTVQARLIAEYAGHLKARKVTLYHPRRTDSYIETLVEAAGTELGALGVPVAETTWQGSAGEVASLCADDVDRSDEIAYYTGREDDFGDFIRSVTKGCTSRRKLPLVVAADAVSRFVAQKENRRHDSLAGQPMSYVGMGSLVTLAALVRRGGAPRTPAGGGNAAGRVLRGVRESPHGTREDAPRRGVAPDTVAGRAHRNAYDVAGLLVEATSTLHERLVHTGQGGGAAPGGGRPAAPGSHLPGRDRGGRLPDLAHRQRAQPRGPAGLRHPRPGRRAHARVHEGRLFDPHATARPGHRLPRVGTARRPPLSARPPAVRPHPRPPGGTGVTRNAFTAPAPPPAPIVRYPTVCEPHSGAGSPHGTTRGVPGLPSYDWWSRGGGSLRARSTRRRRNRVVRGGDGEPDGRRRHRFRQAQAGPAGREGAEDARAAGAGARRDRAGQAVCGQPAQDGEGVRLLGGRRQPELVRRPQRYAGPARRAPRAATPSVPDCGCRHPTRSPRSPRRAGRRRRRSVP